MLRASVRPGVAGEVSPLAFAVEHQQTGAIVDASDALLRHVCPE
jgi:hypothetical protein